MRNIKERNFSEAETCLNRTSFIGWYASLALTSRAWIAVVRGKERQAAAMIQNSREMLSRFDNLDALFIKKYNEYLEAVITDDTNSYIKLWHELSKMESSSIVRDVLPLQALASPADVKSFSQAKTLH
jgi:hypothetical protein